ncbi:MAG: hypothetical protein AAB524_03050 [Patescibacteria group bacterium]
MANVAAKNAENIILSKKDYRKLMEAYQKISEILYTQKKKKALTAPHSLYGIWKGVKVNERDFQHAKKSLFPSSL